MAGRVDQEMESRVVLAPEFGSVVVPSSVYRKAGKRVLDLTLGIPLLLVCLPAIAFLALVIVVTSGWPAFHGSQRMGRSGQFRMWKLRTMVRNADELLEEWKASDPEFAARFEQEYKLQDDPRITKIGRFLRQTSLDELPQLWNVIVGEMSLVGPRPITKDELAHYGDADAEFLSLRPGVTGRWQVSGRGNITYPERTYVELGYCRTLTLSEDVSILLRTLAAPIRGDGT